MTPPQIFDLARPPVRPEEDLAARYRERVLRTFGDRVERIVLYGSRARGDPHDESDWDIAVFLDHEPNDADRDRLRKLEDGLGSGWQLQVLSFAGERWLGGDELMCNIRDHGVILHGHPEIPMIERPVSTPCSTLRGRRCWRSRVRPRPSTAVSARRSRRW